MVKLSESDVEAWGCCCFCTSESESDDLSDSGVSPPAPAFRTISCFSNWSSSDASVVTEAFSSRNNIHMGKVEQLFNTFNEKPIFNNRKYHTIKCSCVTRIIIE